jgi:hypothetical protein
MRAGEGNRMHRALARLGDIMSRRVQRRNGSSVRSSETARARTSSDDANYKRAAGFKLLATMRSRTSCCPHYLCLDPSVPTAGRDPNHGLDHLEQTSAARPLTQADHDVSWRPSSGHPVASITAASPITRAAGPAALHSPAAGSLPAPAQPSSPAYLPGLRYQLQCHTAIPPDLTRPPSWP